MGCKELEAAPFKSIPKELGVEPGECLMVGDWPEVDPAGAKAIGMKACWAKYGSRFEGGIGDYVAEEPGGIIAAVGKLGAFAE